MSRRAAVLEPEAKAASQAGPEEFRIGYYVHDVSRMRRTLFDQALRPLGTTRSQWWVLAQLSRSSGDDERGMLQTELARLLEVGKVSVGGLVDRLEASGCVERRPDPSDRRTKRVVITRKGREVINQMVLVGRTLNISVLAGISEAEVEAAERVLARMKANIQKLIDPSSTT